MINIKAIGISAVLTTGVALGLVFSNQNFAVAAGENSGTDQKATKSDEKTKVPTPALLPGLVALGIGVMRKRKTQESKVNE